jgi:hypothetical protein
MDSGLYAASTALVARTQALDTIANNLANASTVGFRAERNVFSSVLATASGSAAPGLSQVVNRFGILSGTTVDQSQGALQKTGNELDVAIEGSGYFTVQTADGPMYTRNGAFQVSSRGQLVTASGDAVMGDRGVINILPGSVSISADGTISSNGAVVNTGAPPMRHAEGYSIRFIDGFPSVPSFGEQRYACVFLFPNTIYGWARASLLFDEKIPMHLSCGGGATFNLYSYSLGTIGCRTLLISLPLKDV